VGERRPLADAASALLGTTVELIRMLPGGAHAETALIKAGARELVVRRFPSGDDAVDREARVLEHIRALDSLVPQLVAHRTDDDGGLIITTRVAGGPPDPGLAPSDIAPQMARVLARVHALDGVGLDSMRLTPHGGDSAIARAARARPPRRDPAGDVLIHRDAWSGNALWQGSVLTGLVDWSSGCRGPRGLDVAWCRQDLVLLGDPEAADAFLAAYERAGGIRIADLHAWDLEAAAHADPVVESWAENYAGIGRPDITPETLRARLDAWNATLLSG